MSLMRKAVAICTSDIHLSDIAPRARAAEPNWYAAQKRSLGGLTALCHELKPESIILAGDFFDRWNPTPKLINLAIEWAKNLTPKPSLGPSILSIPGQHDIPYHRTADVKESGYGVLVQAGLFPGVAVARYDGLRAFYGFFPWGVQLRPYKEKTDYDIRIAIVHKYVWDEDHKHPEAPEDGHVEKVLEQLEGYTHVICGDNHKPFKYQLCGQTLINCGPLIRRKHDERHNACLAYVIWDDGQVTTVPMHTSEERWSAAEAAKQEYVPSGSVENLIAELSNIKNEQLDFPGALRRAATSPGVDQRTRDIVLGCLDKAH